MNNSLVTYNNENYIQEVVIMGLDENMAPNKTIMIVDNRNILDIGFCSDIRSPILVGYIVINDIEKAIYSTYDSGNNKTLVRLKMSYTKDRLTVDINCDLLFYINGIEIQETSTSSARIKLKLIHIDFFKMSNTPAYASNELPINKLLEDMMIKNKFPVEALEYTSTRSISYINPCNFPLQDAINFVLDRNISEPFIFIRYNHCRGVYDIPNIGLLGTPEIPVNAANTFMLPAKENSAVPDNMKINDLKTLNSLQYYDNYLLFRPIRRKKFDYLHGQMVTEESSLDDLSKNFTMDVERKAETAFTTIPNKREINTEFAANPISRKYTEKVFLEGNAMIFTSVGHISRFAGEKAYVGSELNSGYAPRLWGTWVISRVAHEFRDSQYRNVIHLARMR